MIFTLNIALFGLSVFIYTICRRRSRISVAKIPGPPSKSLLYGNLPELLQCQAGEVEFQWAAKYGDVIRLKAPLGDDVLLISDPKALQYIVQTAANRYPKHAEMNTLGDFMSGPGMLSAVGSDHMRQRKVTLPAFGGSEAKAFLPIFASKTAKIISQWHDILSESTDRTTVIDITSWISRATLDIIGEAAFDYQFGALDNADNAVANACHNLFAVALGTPSNGNILFLTIIKYIPRGLVRFFLNHAPSLRLNHIRSARQTITGVAKALVSEKSAALLQGRHNKDVLSLIVQANASEDPKTRITGKEMLSQMQTLTTAGHETTSATISWTFLELCKQPEIQTKLRQEIRAQERLITERGDVGFSAHDFESMPYLAAVIKESLRLNPATYHLRREAATDDIVPLTNPITPTSGELIKELPIPKGIKLFLSMAGYNRNPKIFGEEPHTFNPDRWLDGGLKPLEKGSSVGVYANLLTFGGGRRSCIGWRFAVQELEVFLVELISKFEFSLTTEAQRVRREACLVITPTIEGQVKKGAQLPLRITIARDLEE